MDFKISVYTSIVMLILNVHYVRFTVRQYLETSSIYYPGNRIVEEVWADPRSALIGEVSSLSAKFFTDFDRHLG
jgi:hypothetical protein